MAGRTIKLTVIGDARALEKALKQGQSSVNKFAAGMQNLGRKMTQYITVPLVGLGALSVKAAMDFESSFAGVKKTVDATDKEFAVMEKQLRGLSKQIPVNINDLNKYAESAGQLGIKKKNIVSFVKVIADLGATTNLAGEEGAQALARFANITGMSQKKFKNLGSTIVALGNAGASTEQEIMMMGLRLAGAGKVVKLTQPQILGFANALSSVGIEAQAGGTAFSKVFIELATAGGAKLAKFGKVAGMTGAQFKKAFKDDAAGATISFVEGLGKIQQSGGDLFGVLEDLGITETRMRDALLRAAGAGDLMRQSIDMGTKSWGENNALTEEAQKRYDTFASKFEILKNKIGDVAIDIGNILMPELVKVADEVEKIVGKFNSLDTERKKTIISWAGWAAVAGPLLLIVGSLARALTSIITALQVIGGIFASIWTPILIGVGLAVALGVKLQEKFGDIGIALSALLGPAAMVGSFLSDWGNKVTPAIRAVERLMELLGLASNKAHTVNSAVAHATRPSPTGGTAHSQSAKAHADGLDYVPYDNYPAILHKGEAVLTAKENKGRQGGTYSFAGATFVLNVPSGKVRDMYSELQRLTSRANLMSRA